MRAKRWEMGEGRQPRGEEKGRREGEEKRGGQLGFLKTRKLGQRKDAWGTSVPHKFSTGAPCAGGIKKMDKWVDPIFPSLQICKDRLKKKRTNCGWKNSTIVRIAFLTIQYLVFTTLLVISISDTKNYITNFWIWKVSLVVSRQSNM